MTDEFDTCMMYESVGQFHCFFEVKYSLPNPVRTDLPVSVVLNIGIFSNRNLFDYQRVKLSNEDRGRVSKFK